MTVTTNTTLTGSSGNPQITAGKLVENMSTAPTSTNARVNVYAVNYNVLRIMSGMGGLAYSN